MTTIERRFKLLALMAMHLKIWDEKMDELAFAIDTKHPQAKQALEFYELNLIRYLEA